MRKFAAITAMAAERKGGMAMLELMLADTPALPPGRIAATPDDRILSAMTRRIFNAGFSSKVIDGKWPAFEAAFHNFDPRRCAHVTEAEFDALTRNSGIVRNGAKIRSVQVNASLILDLAREHHSAAQGFAAWPDSDYIGLLELLKKRGSHLGGDSAMRFLRAIGKPAWIPTPDVSAALIREGVVDRVPRSKADFRSVQDACNAWSADSGRDLTAISRILSMTVESAGRHG